LTDGIEFEPPRGLLGRLLGAKTVLHELQELFAYRERRLRELLDSEAAPHP
jgi:hypothetical protein